MTVNWNNIRLHQGSQDQGFEELCCQLFHNEPLSGTASFERRGYRDAGLECAHILRDGTFRGMQAKFFTRSPTASEWAQVDDSIRTAINKNPQLRHLTLCIPQNFDDPKIPNQVSAMDKWKSHKAIWEKLASDAGRQIEFELWGDTQLTERLTQPANRGKLWYFFNQEELTPEWFRRHGEAVAANAKPRYTEELNVDLPISQLFEGLGRTKQFSIPLRKHYGKLSQLLSWLERDTIPSDAVAVVGKIRAVGQSLCEMMAECDLFGVTPLPLDRLKTLSGHLYTAIIEAEPVLKEAAEKEITQAQAEWKASGRPGHFQSHTISTDLRHELSQFRSEIYQIEEFVKSETVYLANQPFLLVSGTAGKGKTHLLVDVAKRRAVEGLPTLLFLGENFRDHTDPINQMMEMAGLSLQRDEFLQVLETVAEEKGGRLLLMIDALNEGEGQQLWPKQLAGFLKTIEHHPRIGVVLSVRTTYEEVVLPDAVSKTLIRVTHEGFASKPEAAARIFFAHYNLHLPKVPLLNPEFTNPLFLKLMCQGLQSEGLHDIPDGYEGITQMFAFLIQATERKLKKEKKIDVAPHEHPIQDYLDQLADTLAANQSGNLSFAEADALSRSRYSTSGYTDSLLDLLLKEGLIAREMMFHDDGHPGEEGIRFAYQRFGDHEVARRLLDRHCSQNPEQAFKPDGQIGRLFADGRGYYRHRGLLEAFSIQVPERFGREIATLLEPLQDEYERWWRDHALGECLLESLLWRRKETITEEVFSLLQSLDAEGRLFDRYVEILLMLAAVPDHPLNANRLHNRLSNVSLPECDVFWTIWLHRNSDAEGAVDRLLTWGLLSEEKSHLDDEAIILASTALAWLTASTVRSVRDRSTKGLVRLLTPRSHLIDTLLDRFSDVDDRYVTERLYAAAYGVALRLQNNDSLCCLAETVYQHLFTTKPVLPDVLVRDYGRCIIERAVERGCALSFDAQNSRPPYESVLPSEPPSRKHFEGMVKRHKEWTDSDRAIYHITNRFDSPDVSEYYGGPSFRDHKFTAIPLSESVPLSNRQRQEQWEDTLTPEQKDWWEVAQSIRFRDLRIVIKRADGENDEEVYVLNSEEGSDEETIGSENLSAFDVAIASLKATLTSEQSEALDGLLSSDSRTESLPVLPDDLFGRYVIQRALDLGWTAERFAQFDAMIERARDRRDDKAFDSIGAKYLWMAYYEIFARLADNYHYLSGYSETEAAPFEGTWQDWLRAIDPSYLPNESPKASVRSKKEREWWLPTDYHLDNVRGDHWEWLRREDDLPMIRDILVVKDNTGQEWITLEQYLTWRQKEEWDEGRIDHPYRYFWLQLRGYLVKQQDANALCSWMEHQDFMGRWMPESHDFHQIFLGEFYTALAWQHTITEDNWDYQEWRRPQRECPIELAHTEETYIQIEADTVPTPGHHVMMPSPLLMREAGIRWSGNVGEWIDRNGELVVQYPSVKSNSSGALLIRRDFLERFLQQQGYELLWTLLGEKQVIRWNNHSPHLSITGCGRYTQTEPAVSLRMEYKGDTPSQ